MSNSPVEDEQGMTDAKWHRPSELATEGFKVGLLLTPL